MLKILKNLKESILLVIAIIILLCVQAAADLNLPDFTSKIVNVGLSTRWYRRSCSRCNKGKYIK